MHVYSSSKIEAGMKTLIRKVAREARPLDRCVSQSNPPVTGLLKILEDQEVAVSELPGVPTEVIPYILTGMPSCVSDFPFSYCAFGNLGAQLWQALDDFRIVSPALPRFFDINYLPAGYGSDDSGTSETGLQFREKDINEQKNGKGEVGTKKRQTKGSATNENFRKAAHTRNLTEMIETKCLKFRSGQIMFFSPL